jgi:pimeloyl-ACP methyl ester carboxylesterase
MRKFTVMTADNERIAGAHYEGQHRRVVILAHGFYNNKDVLLFREIATALSKYYDVVAFDFRGHGQSTGVFSWTSREMADIQAVMAYVRTYSYDAIGMIGFSLGAAMALIAAAAMPDIASVIAVSAPYDFWHIDYRFWEPGMLKDLQLNLGYKGRGKRVLPGNPWDKKVAPLLIVDKIAPRPVCFVHGSKDWLIHMRHSQKLFAQAKDPRRLEIIDGGGHAEKLYDESPELLINLFRNQLDKTLIERV